VVAWSSLPGFSVVAVLVYLVPSFWYLEELVPTG